MKIKLLDWSGKASFVDVDIDKVAVMTIRVVTGDEILNVIYKDYSVEEFDSCNAREMDFYDGSYEIYDFRNNKDDNLLFDKRFLNRTSSYDDFEDFEDDEDD